MKISVEEYVSFLEDRLKYQYNELKSGEVRMGQVFLNTFWSVLKLSEPDPELFYETNMGRCFDLIRAKYINLKENQ